MLHSPPLLPSNMPIVPPLYTPLYPNRASRLALYAPTRPSAPRQPASDRRARTSSRQDYGIKGPGLRDHSPVPSHPLKIESMTSNNQSGPHNGSSPVPRGLPGFPNLGGDSMACLTGGGRCRRIVGCTRYDQTFSPPMSPCGAPSTPGPACHARRMCIWNDFPSVSLRRGFVPPQV